MTENGKYDQSVKASGRGGRYVGSEDKATENNRYGSLHRSIQSSYRAMDPFRRLFRSLVYSYAGPGYGENYQKDKYLNKMHQAIDAYMMLLAANRPKVLVSTHHADLFAFAKHYELAVNNLIKEIGLEQTIRRWVMDAFFCIGIVKTYLGDSGRVVMETDRQMDPGSPFAENVSLDNFCFDMCARTWGSIGYAADMYRLSFADFQEGIETGMFDAKASRNIQPSNTLGVSGERLEELSRGYDLDEYEPMVDLADVWVPRERSILTFQVIQRDTFSLGGPPLAEMEWTASEHGPYHLLGFNDVPDSILPLSPASHLFGLDDAINVVMRKSVSQAKRQKDIPVYTPAGYESAKRVQRAGDGQLTEVNDIREIGSYKTGGVDQANLAFLLQMLEQFDSQAGNLTALLGLGAQAETLGQEELIHSAGSRKGGQMQYRVLDATTKLITSLGGMLWEDQFKEIVSEYEIGGTGMSVMKKWTPDDREGDFQDYNFDIVAYSMAYQPPGKKVEALNMLLQNVYMPGFQMLAQQGGNIDFQELTDIYSDFLDLPRLRRIITFTGETGGGPGPMTDLNQGKPAVTSRSYTRKNIPTGGTPQSRSHVMQQALLGQSPSAQQMNSMNAAPTTPLGG